jgi:hypothetical protein
MWLSFEWVAYTKAVSLWGNVEIIITNLKKLKTFEL